MRCCGLGKGRTPRPRTGTQAAEDALRQAAVVLRQASCAGQAARPPCGPGTPLPSAAWSGHAVTVAECPAVTQAVRTEPPPAKLRRRRDAADQKVPPPWRGG